MHKLMLLISLICLTAFAVSCTPAHDKAGFEYVKSYSEEIIPAVENATRELNNWLDDDSYDDINKLIECAEAITDINHRYWTEQFPDDRDIEKWSIEREYNSLTWTIEGNELADALWFTGAE